MAMTMNDAYRYLKKQFSRLSSIEDALGILGWDKEVMMPLGAAKRRAENLASLEGLYHEIVSDRSISDALIKANVGSNPWDKANIREMSRAYRHAQALPETVIEETVKTSSQSEMAWRDGLKTGTFKEMIPIFEQVVELTQKKADILAEKFSLDPYDALLDSFEPGLRQAIIDPLFAQLRHHLPSLIKDITEKQQSNPPLPSYQGIFPEEKQKKLGQYVMQKLGFDNKYGRIDTSLHPFCGGARDDIRITTRYDHIDYLPALMGTIHETGHALYDLGLPPLWKAQPVGQAGGMLLHESQSLTMEMGIGRSREFVHWLMPILHHYFPKALADYNEEALYQQLTHVQPGFIRVDADEVTYPAHILIRYQIEKELLNGTISVKKLPERFNELVYELLGLNVKDDRQGCWQDIHWPEGLFGYFPCYSLGAFAAAQFKETAFQQELCLPDFIARGDFSPFRNWLKTHIHAQGRLPQTLPLIEHVTSQPLKIEPWLRHIQNRYLK